MNDDHLDQRLREALSAHRDATEARRAAGLVVAPRALLPAPSPGHPAGRRRQWAPPGARPWLVVASAIALVVALLAGIAAMDRGGALKEQRIDAAATTLPRNLPSDSTTIPLGAGESATTSVVSPGPDRSAALWFRNHYEGLADDQGVIYRHRAQPDYVGPMVRVATGDVYLLQDEQLFVLPSGATEPQPLAVEGPVMTIELNETGEPIWLDPDGHLHTLDGRAARLGPMSSRTAANGWTASVTDPVVTRQAETDLIEAVDRPAELVITDRSGGTVWRYPVGGANAAMAVLEDFDGRRVIVSRAPEEPAGSPSQMLLIDLVCDPVCVRTSIGLGDTVLNGADVTGDPPLAADGTGAGGSAGFRLGLCPTEGSAAPDPPAGLTSLAKNAYRRLALGLATCDPFSFQAASADATVDWSALAAALAAPPIEGSEGGQTAWTFTDPTSERWLSIDAAGLWTVGPASG